MKLKYILLSFFFGFMTSHAEWWARVVLFANDNGTWKVLLRYDPTAKIWTDFKKNGTGSAKKAFVLGEEILKEQIGGNYYHLSAEQIKPIWIHHKSKAYQSDDFIHFVIVPFIQGKTLYEQARVRNITDDFAWIDFNTLINNQVITKKGPRGPVKINIDPELREILKDNEQKINNELLNKRAQQPQLSLQKQGEWASIPGAIYFYNAFDDYYQFTNFWKSPVTIDGKVWPTTEHYYQAMKFNDTTLQDNIRNMQSPSKVFTFAQRNKNNVRPDWQSVNLDIMMKANRAKFNQHEALKKILLDTGNAILIENTAADPQQRNDMFFGAGNNFDGKNHLGQILMQIRDELRGSPQHAYQPQPASYYTQKQQPIIQQPTQYKIIINNLTQQLSLLTEALENVLAALQSAQKRQSCLIQ